MCGECLILVYWIVQLLKRKGTVQADWKRLLILLGGCILLFDSSKIVRITPQIFKGEILYTYREQAEAIVRKTEKGSKIFLVNSSPSAGMNMTYLAFYLEGRKFGDYNTTDFSKINMADDKFWNNVICGIEKCDYLYIYDTCDAVDQIIGVYADVETFESGGLYKIEKGKELKLNKM